MILFFIRLISKIYRPKPSLHSSSLSGESARDAYAQYLSLTYLLLTKTYPSLSILEARKNENGTSYFLNKKSDLDHLRALLLNDIKALAPLKLPLEDFEVFIQSELSAFVDFDLLVAETYPIICSYCVEISSLRMLNQLILLSKKGNWSNEACLFLASTQKKDTQDIFSALKKLSKKKSDAILFFITLDTFFHSSESLINVVEHYSNQASKQ